MAGFNNGGGQWGKRVDEVKSESNSSTETKPKINIISDIKIEGGPIFPKPIPEGKKINIISDIKLDIKKEDIKFEVKKEENGSNDSKSFAQMCFDKIDFGDVKTEPKSDEGKEESKSDELPPIQPKFNLLPMDDPNSDGIPYDWVSSFY